MSIYHFLLLITILTFTIQHSQLQSEASLQNKAIELLNAINQYNTSFLSDWKTNFDKSSKQQYIEILNSEIYRLKKILSEVVVQQGQIEPFVKWFQNKTHIFLTIKNSHRWDSPPCLNIKHLNCKINSNNLTYQSHCIVSHSHITFRLHLDLFQEIQTENCQNAGDNESCELQLMNDGVGVFSLIIKKTEAGIWDYLTQEQKHYPIWQNLVQSYPQDYKVYLSRLQAIQRAKTKSSESTQTLTLYFVLFVLMWTL